MTTQGSPVVIALGLRPEDGDAFDATAAGWTVVTVPPLPVEAAAIVLGDGTLDDVALVDALLSGGPGTRVLPLEGFADLSRSGLERWRDKKWMLEATEVHLNLREAKYLTLALRTHVRWPALTPTDRAIDGNRPVTLNERSLLAEAGLVYSHEQLQGRRRETLRIAVDKFGLRYVVAWLRWRLVSAHGRARRNDAHRAALDVYADDLEWLKTEHPGTEINWPGKAL